MAYNGAKQPLVLGLSDPAPQINPKKAPKRRRNRRSNGVLQADKVPQELTLLPSESNFLKLHPSLKQLGIYLAVYIGVGTICFYLVRNQIKGKKTNGIIDSLYLCVSTMTTVGYGDLVPNRIASKLLASVLAFAGMALVGLILSKASDYLVEKQEIMLVKALHMDQKVKESTHETKKVRYKCLLVIIVNLGLMFLGTIVLSLFEGLDFADSIYCVCSTVTTLGYGDKSFQSSMGRFFAVFWILSNSTCLSHLFLYIAEIKIASRQRSLVNWVLTWRMKNVDLEASDLDDDMVVGAAEFIIDKLKEMGKISEEDIALVMEKFDVLDVDQAGTLSASDLMLAQSSETGR